MLMPRPTDFTGMLTIDYFLLWQRVLEHCTDEQKQNSIMEDILRSACNLAQDQYGNYVVQVGVPCSY